jgi:hypothetical protein
VTGILWRLIFQLFLLASKSRFSALFLVCDWNVRAWTLLEGIRGRRNIHLLCRDDKVISLKRLLLDIYHHGAIDIATLSLAARHLLPARPWIDPELEEHISGTTGAEREARIKDFEDVVRESSFTQWGEMNERGFVHIDEAGGLLSHRLASRPGDDVVIWSLLLGDQAFHNAQDL